MTKYNGTSRLFVVPPEAIGIRKGSVSAVSGATSHGIRLMKTAAAASTANTTKAPTIPSAGWRWTKPSCEEFHTSSSSSTGARVSAPSIAQARRTSVRARIAPAASSAAATTPSRGQGPVSTASVSTARNLVV